MSSVTDLPFSRHFSLVCFKFCEADEFPDSLTAPKKVSECKKPTGVTKRIQSTIFPVSGKIGLGAITKQSNKKEYKSLVFQIF